MCDSCSKVGDHILIEYKEALYEVCILDVKTNSLIVKLEFDGEIWELARDAGGNGTWTFEGVEVKLFKLQIKLK